MTCQLNAAWYQFALNNQLFLLSFIEFIIFCSLNQIRIHVYSANEYPQLLDLQNCARRWHESQWGIEYAVHQWLYHTYHVNAADADLFYVPIYFKCVSTRRGQAYVSKRTIPFLEHLKYFQVSGGEDHIFLFASGAGPTRFTQWREYLPNSIFIMTEGHYSDAASIRWQAPYFNPHKDILIPGYTGNKERMLLFRKFNRDMREREHLVTYIGNDQGRYTRMKLRELANAFAGLVNCPGPLRGSRYIEALGNSKFCFVPRGLSSWSLRLYESFLAGCIPVMLNDYLRFPFSKLIFYPSISVKWPEKQVGESLVAHLVSINNSLLAHVHTQISKAACYFQYALPTDMCSAFTGLSTELRSRVTSTKSSPAVFWTLNQSSVVNDQLIEFENWELPVRVKDVFDGRAKVHYGNQE